MRKYIGKIRSEKDAKKARRKLYIRKRLTGTTERPRVCAVKSNKHLSVQVVDDSQGKTLFVVQTFGKNAVPGATKGKDGATLVGKAVAEKLGSQGIKTVVFDKNGSKYTGLIANIANALRENGVQV